MTIGTVNDSYVFPEDYSGTDDQRLLSAMSAAAGTGKLVWLSRMYDITQPLRILGGAGLASNSNGGLRLPSAFGASVVADFDDWAEIKTKSAVYIEQSNNVVIRDIIIEKASADKYAAAIAAQACTGLIIDGVEIRVPEPPYYWRNRGGYINVNSVEQCRISNCNIHDLSTAATADYQMTGIEVDNYRMPDDSVGGLNSRGVMIIGNRIARISGGGKEKTWQTDGVNLQGSGLGHVVQGNIIQQVGEGIDVFTPVALVSGNLIDGAYIFGIKLIHGARRCVISGNVIREPGKAGIVLQGSVSGAEVEFNLVSGNSIINVDSKRQWTDTATAAILLEDAASTSVLRCQRNTILHNNVVRDGANDNMDYVVLDLSYGGNHYCVGNVSRNTYDVAYSYRPNNVTSTINEST